MANVWFAKGIKKIAQGAIAWESDTIKAYLIDSSDYTLDRSAHEFLSDVPSGARVASVTLSGCSVSDDGILDADDAEFASLTGDSCEALIIAKSTGSDATSPLLLYIDTAVGLPLTPSGVDETVAWDNGANKIARLY